MTRMKVAELTSGVGALMLGIGIGALAPQWFSPSAGLMVLAGAVSHAFGMWYKHRLEAPRGADTGRLVVALYWVCWLLLAGVVLFLFDGR